MTYTQRIYALVLCVLSLFGGVFFAPVAQAQSITNEQIGQQKEEVKTQLLRTLEEQVKLLQMILIRHLEAQLAQLQAQQQ